MAELHLDRRSSDFELGVVGACPSDFRFEPDTLKVLEDLKSRTVDSAIVNVR